MRSNHFVFCLSAIVAWAVCFLLLSGCTGSGEPTQVSPGVGDGGGQLFTEVLAELTSLPVPQNTDEAMFEKLKSELIHQLELVGKTKFTSKLAVGQISDFTIEENGDGTMTVNWSYRNLGDYDLNGEVNIADLTPIAMNYGQSITESNRSSIGHIDGDGNGEINLADITAIALNFMGQIEGYFFQSNRYPGNDDTWETISDYKISDLGALGGNRDTQLSIVIPIVCSQLEFRVVAYNGAEAGEGSNSDQPDAPPEPEVYVITGTVSTPEGTPIQATISIPEMEPILVDENGAFSISVDDPEVELIATFTADGYANTTKPLTIGSATQRNFTISMLPVEEVLSVYPSSLSMLSMQNGVTVTLSPGSLVDSLGAPMLDETLAELTFFDPTDPQQLAAAPGDLSAIQMDESEVDLETFGMLEVRIDDSNGSLANLGDGQEAPITFPVAEEMRGRAPETIGLYSFDEESGKWIEEGIATLDPSGEFYLANVSHFSTWNCDRPQEVTAIHVQVQDQTGVAMEGVEVVATGVDYSGDRKAFTNENGIACLLVRRNSVVDICAKYFGFVSESIEASTPDTQNRCENPQQTPLVATIEIPLGTLFEPVVLFSADPPFGELPLTVSFDASDSFDRDGGQIVKYEWNFDTEANPHEWHDNGDNPHAQVTYDSGTDKQHVTAGLRLTDQQGQVNISYIIICLHDGLSVSPG